MILISVISTLRRRSLAPSLYACLKAQTHTHWEWIVDGIEGLKDDRIKPITHAPQGEVIAYFDEQVYYAPRYLQARLEHLTEVDYSYLTGWYGYDVPQSRPLYWSEEQPLWESLPKEKTHFWLLNKTAGIELREIDPHLKRDPSSYRLFGYCHRPLEKYGGRAHHIADEEGLLIWKVYDAKILDTALYFRLPVFLFEKALGQTSIAKQFPVHVHTKSSVLPKISYRDEGLLSLSLITPTEGREAYLKCAYSLLLQQTVSDWRWYIADSSAFPSPFFSHLNDPRVEYHFMESSMTIGEKRNFLIEHAQGPWIIHIDDDDYYAPNYLETIGPLMENADFIAITSWYAYDLKAHQGFYWLTTEPSSIHHIVEPLSGAVVKQVITGASTPTAFTQGIQKMGACGYGFAYVYKKVVWEKTPFPPVDFKEDSRFFETALHHGFIVRTYEDQQGVIVKIIHDQNVSCIYPQYRLPDFLFRRTLPHFMEQLDAYCAAYHS